MLRAPNAIKNYNAPSLLLSVCDAKILMLLDPSAIVFADDTCEGAIVCFDGVMTKLHNISAGDAGQMLAIYAEEGVSVKDSKLLPFITEMKGRTTFTFQVRVSSYKFTVHHQTFTITRILNENERAPVPNFVLNGGNDNDDMPDGNVVPVQVEAGEGSSGADVNADVNPAGATPKERARSPSNDIKRARVA